jgi:hypothetical protein
MRFDIVRAPADSGPNHEHGNVLLVNSYLDSLHSRQPEPIDRNKEIQRLSDTIARGLQVQYSFDDKRELREIFDHLDLSWKGGQSAADKINQNLIAAKSPYRVQLEGPVKRENPMDALVSPSVFNMQPDFDYRLTITDSDGKPLSVQALPGTWGAGATMR